VLPATDGPSIRERRCGPLRSEPARRLPKRQCFSGLPKIGEAQVTADRIFIDAATHSRTTTKDVYYVAISRARLEARIYTNEVEKLPQAIARGAHKHAALDLERG